MAQEDESHMTLAEEDEAVVLHLIPASQASSYPTCPSSSCPLSSGGPENTGGVQDEVEHVVYRTSQSTLAHIPYFATCLSEVWRSSASSTAASRQGDGGGRVHVLEGAGRHVGLVCSARSSPPWYVRCCEIVAEARESGCWAYARLIRGGPIEALRLLPVADHLLFQDLADACMGRLACAVWSPEEEDAIRAFFLSSTPAIMPSDDVQQRLSINTSEAVALKRIISSLLVTRPSLGAAPHQPLREFAKKCLQHASEAVPAISASILLDLWNQLLGEVIEGVIGQEKLHAWLVLTEVLVECSVNVEEMVAASVPHGRQFCRAITAANFGLRPGVAGRALAGLFAAVGRGHVLLGNAQRLALVQGWQHLADFLNHPAFSSLLTSISQTLPPNDAAVWPLVERSECFGWWSDRILYRLAQLEGDSVTECCATVSSPASPNNPNK